MSASPQPHRIRGRVWSTPRDGGRTWHFSVHRPDGAIVLYDNTGYWGPMVLDCLMGVAVLRRLETSGHPLQKYTGDVG